MTKVKYNFDVNVTPIENTKRCIYTCVECGIKKEAFKARLTRGAKFCSPKCGAIARGRLMKNMSVYSTNAVPRIEPGTGKGRHVTKNCKGCNAQFTKYHAPGAVEPSWCTPSCFRNRRKNKKSPEWNCVGCSMKFYRKKRPSEDIPQFCTVICKNKSITNKGVRIKRPNEIHYKETTVLPSNSMVICLGLSIVMHVCTMILMFVLFR